MLKKSCFLCIFLLSLGIKNVYIMLISNIFCVSMQVGGIFYLHFRLFDSHISLVSWFFMVFVFFALGI